MVPEPSKFRVLLWPILSPTGQNTIKYLFHNMRTLGRFSLRSPHACSKHYDSSAAVVVADLVSHA
ncbi:hypothetical protein ARTHRO8AJ_290008 [Arthrobacter sp. 8AJ]|nr:hypothetical protein ARTHRO8AJ_290008 [Arthrobacter sp. 8AJ]